MGRMKDIAIDVMAYEMGELDERGTLELFALLVKAGLAWTLQGSYGRTARRMIDEGYLTEDGRVTEFADQGLELVTT